MTPMLDGLLGELRVNGGEALWRDQTPIASLERSPAVSQPTIDEGRLKIECLDKAAWTRGVPKIILCGCRKILGAEWAWTKEASLIRRFVLNAEANWPAERPRGYIAGEWDRELRTALGNTAAVRSAKQHTVAVLPFREDGGAVALVSLFGGDRVPETVIHVGKLPQRTMSALRGAAGSNVALGYRVDPATRTTVPITFGEIRGQGRS